MSEFEATRKYIGETEYNNILVFLEEHGEYTLDDLIYDRNAWETYQNEKRMNKLFHYYEMGILTDDEFTAAIKK